MLGISSISALAGTSFLTSVLSLPLAMSLARSWNLIDQPIHRKTHKKPIPYLGGVAIFLGVVASLLLVRKLYAPLDQSGFSQNEFSKIIAIVSAGLSAMIFGLIDDKFQVRARYKLIWQLMITTAFATLGYHFELLRIPGFEPISLGLLSVPFTVLWMLTVLNGFNLIDGVDGLAGTVSVVIFAMVALNGVLLNDIATTTVAIAAVGAVIAFLIFNWKPAKIYLGDAGSTGLGVMAAASLIALGNQHGVRMLEWSNDTLPSEPFMFQFPAITMIAIYPILEVVLSTVRRFIRGKSISSADTAHIHHKLLFNGWSATTISLAAGGLSIISGLILWTNLAYTRGFAAWLVLLSGALIGILLHYCGYLRALHPNSIRDSRPHYLIANHFASMQMAKLSAARTLDDLLEVINQTCAEFGVESYEIHIDTDNPNSRHAWRNESVSSRSYISFVFRREPESTHIDRVHLPDSKSRAQWSIFPSDLEEDLKTEHRVLLSGFMKRALKKLEDTFE